MLSPKGASSELGYSFTLFSSDSRQLLLSGLGRQGLELAERDFKAEGRQKEPTYQFQVAAPAQRKPFRSPYALGSQQRCRCGSLRDTFRMSRKRNSKRGTGDDQHSTLNQAARVLAAGHAIVLLKDSSSPTHKASRSGGHGSACRKAANDLARKRMPLQGPRLCVIPAAMAISTKPIGGFSIIKQSSQPV